MGICINNEFIEPFRLPKLPKKPIKQEPVLITPQDYLDQGVEEEESGDRWLLSDLSKSLRFYQKAYDYYIQGIEKDSKFVDCYYNANRLLFHVYETYHSLNINDLKNVEECAVILGFGISDIKHNHETVIKKFIEIGEEGLINWEFYYNLLLINTEWVEKNDDLSFDQVQTVLKDSIEISGKVLDYQLVELDKFVKRLENDQPIQQNQPSHEVTNESQTDGDKDGENNEESYDVIVQITPSLVFDTLLSTLKLIQAVYESVDNEVQLNYLQSSLTEFLSKLDLNRQLLLNKFNPVNPDPYGINLKLEETNEFELVKSYIEGLFIKEFPQLQEHWSKIDSQSDEFLLSKYLIEADSYESFRDTHHEELSSEQSWEIITQTNGVYKKAQELLKLELQQEINLKSNKVSEKVSKSVQVLIHRADNELARGSLPNLAVAAQNNLVLKNNAIALLKNGLTLTNTNVGLRESAGDRLKREKLRRECTIRLTVLTRETVTEQDLIRNLGEAYYKAETAELSAVPVYREYLHPLNV